MAHQTALLIDGDQVPCAFVGDVLARISKESTVNERICVRNWRSTKDQKEWRAFSAEHGIRCLQRDPVATGKNAADIEIAIIAMDLYHGLGYRHFCLVTGDMDFQPLVERLRRAACTVDWVVPGRGARGSAKPAAKSSTPSAKSTSRGSRRKSTAAASKQTAAAPAKPAPQATPAKPKAASQLDVDGFAKAVRKSITDLRAGGEHERGWVSVNRLGSALRELGKTKEDYGFPKRRALYQALEEASFKVEQTETGAYRVTL